jgi:hypothetical protein
MHLDVIAYTDATNAGNRHNLSEVKVDIISTQQKRQHNLGRFDVLVYFEQTKKIMKLKWLVLFDDDKKGGERKSSAMLCHHEMEK